MSSLIPASASRDVAFNSQINNDAGNSWGQYFSGVARRTTMAALPTIALITLANFPVADSGPVTYYSCVGACEATAVIAAAATGGALAPAAAASLVACSNWCLGLLPLPFCP